MCGGPSQAEYTAQEQAAQESTMLQNTFQTQFGEQQGLLNNFLIPQLQGMITNPAGFGPAGLADLTSQLVNTTGAQAANAKQGAQAQFDTNNLAGLPSGVKEAVMSQIASGAGNQVASGQTQIGIANAQLKSQQQQFGLQGLAGAEQALGQVPQSGQLMLGANQNSAQQAQAISQQGNMWQNILGGVVNGVVGAGMGLATGGLSTLFSGGGGIGSALFGLGGGGAGAGAAGGVPITSSPIPNTL